MKFLVLNGSPKGNHSVTLQTVLYLQKRFPRETFEILNIGQQIRVYEKDFSLAEEAFKTADVILFSYPVYTFISTYQMHRFIELMKEHNVDIYGKFACQITTSKHFYDMTAHKFIEENCYDMGLKYLGGLSADMDDLRTPKGRRDADCFFEKVLFDIKNDIYTTRVLDYKLQEKAPYSAHLECTQKSDKKDVVVVTNASHDDINLINIIEDFKNVCRYKVRVVNIRDFKFSGGCLGCFSCASSGKCIYKDHFDEFLRNEIQCADAIINAFTIENHYTHSSFKCYDDRQFCNGHRTVTQGKVTGYIISGNYSAEQNLKTIVEGRNEVSGMYACGIATDENDTEKSIVNLAKSVEFALEHKLQRPENFYGVGGTKIFRDLVYVMQGLMQADHKFYKKTGVYDFPQKKVGTILQMKVIGAMMKNEKVQKKMRGKMSDYIVMPYQKVLDKTEPMNGAEK